ncbi:MAG: hypothetical protein ABJC33_08450 [Betaproteobacteria bacterium]
MKLGRILASCTLAATVSGLAAAQSTIGYGTAILIPIVAQTASFSTEVWVQSPASNNPVTPLTVDISFFEANTSATPGPKSCGQVVVFPDQAQSFALGTKCSLTVGVSHHGMLVIEDAAPEQLNAFFAYSRTQNPQAIGFSVEGFPAGSLSAQSQRVAGLKRALPPAPIPFQTNCFVGALPDPVNYLIRLYDGTTTTQLGSGVTGTLLPFQMIRHLDIFAAAGLATGDYTNVTARIQTTNTNGPGNNDRPLFVSFCTVQDNNSFGADFRIGKSFQAFDEAHSQAQFGCIPADPDCASSYDFSILDVTKKHVFNLFVRPPDNIKCELQSNRLSDLEMQLREPGPIPLPFTFAVPGTPLGATGPGAVVAGGNNQTSFYYSTGPRTVRLSDGASMRSYWTLEVSARETLPAPTTPIPYSITCRSGNGVLYWTPTTSAGDDF